MLFSIKNIWFTKFRKISFTKKSSRRSTIARQIRWTRLSWAYSKSFWTSYWYDLKHLWNFNKNFDGFFYERQPSIREFKQQTFRNHEKRAGLASYLKCPLSKITNLEKTTQFKLVKDSIWKRVNDLLIYNTIPINLYYNLLTLRDTGKEFELQEVLLKMITNKNYNVELASLADKKISDFAKEMHFDVRDPGNKSTGDSTLINLLKSPAIMASGISTIFSSSDPNE